MRVLILDGHSSAAVEAAQSLGRSGAEVDVASETQPCVVFASRYIARRLVQPPSAPTGAALEWLEAMHRERKYDAIVPCTDVGLQLMRRLDEGHPARLKAALASNRALDVALDKIATHDLARSLGIPVPEALTIAQHAPVPESARYPVVLKSSHSRVVIEGENRRLEAAIVMDAQERARLLARWLPYTPVQQQEFVRGRGFGIEMLFRFGRPLWYFAHERIHEMPLTGGGSSYRRSIAPPPDLLRMAERLLSELAWHGVAMVEFRGDGRERNYLMEINPRLWGSLALPIDCGVDFPVGLAALASGAPLPAQPRYRVHYYTRHPSADFQWQKKNLRADHSDPLLLTRPRLRSALELLRPLAGRESWDHFDWRDLGVTGQVLRELYSWECAHLRARVSRRLLKRRAHGHHRRVMQSLAQLGRPSRVLFLCYGNICRSPVAALLAEREFAGIQVRSAGFHRTEGRMSPGHVVQAARSLGIDLMPHRSRHVTETEVSESDLVLCMDLENFQALLREYPEAKARTTLLGLFARKPTVEIADPYASCESGAAAVIDTLRSSVQGMRSWLDTLPGKGKPEALLRPAPRPR